MNQIIRLEQPKVTEQEVLAALKMPEDSEQEDLDRMMDLFSQAQKIAVPKAVYRVALIGEKQREAVVIEGVKLQSSLVRQNLDRVNRIIPYVATCGTELEEWSHGFIDPLEAYWADGIKLIYLAKARRALTEEVRQAYFPVGNMSSMNPGSLAQWPLREQAAIFCILGNVTEQIGVSLTDSFLMLPSKSVSGFYFSSSNHYENCMLCPMKNCPNRRAPFQERDSRKGE